MRDDAGINSQVIPVLIFVFVSIVLGGGAILYHSTACHARWDGSRVSQWGLFSGCRWESEGKLVPESRIWFERNPE